MNKLQPEPQIIVADKEGYPSGEGGSLLNC